MATSSRTTSGSLLRRPRSSTVTPSQSPFASVVQQIAPSPVARPFASVASSRSASSSSTTCAVRDDASCSRSNRRCSSRCAAACRELNITAATNGSRSSGASTLWRDRLNAITPSGDAPSDVSAAVGAERASTTENRNRSTVASTAAVNSVSKHENRSAAPIATAHAVASSTPVRPTAWNDEPATIADASRFPTL